MSDHHGVEPPFTLRGMPLLGIAPQRIRQPLATLTAAAAQSNFTRLQIGPKHIAYLALHPDDVHHILYTHAAT